MRAGLYIHFPFCRTKCPYCHFYSLAGRDDLFPEWWAGLRREGERFVRENLIVDTVYIGGGTPSLLQPQDIRAIRGLLDARFWLKAEEFTLEANPDLEDDSVLAGWREAGVTRLSIGVQSFDDGVLGTLGRGYRAERALEFSRAARQAGFASVSLDLMIGVPGESLASAEKTLAETVRIGPDHVSLYILENVEELPFEKVLKDHPVDEDAVAEVYRTFRQGLEWAGLKQYEISNFARPGKECLHNLKYWRYEPFLGLGPSACSHVAGRRWCNKRELGAWADALAGGGPLHDEMVELTPAMSAKEALIFGLRLAEGVDLTSLRDRFGEEAVAAFAGAVAGLEGEGWLLRDGNWIRIPQDRFLVSNHVFSKFV